MHYHRKRQAPTEHELYMRELGKKWEATKPSFAELAFHLGLAIRAYDDLRTAFDNRMRSMKLPPTAEERKLKSTLDTMVEVARWIYSRATREEELTSEADSPTSSS